MSGDTSLIRFLAAPVLVVDPEGHLIYSNPAFNERFAPGQGSVLGEDLAAVFAGEGREAILRTVVDVSATGTQCSFRLREAGRGYLAQATAIETDGSRVGVMVLLTDELQSDERLLAFHGHVLERLDEIRSVFDELFEQTGGRRAEIYRHLVERGMLALERVRKRSDEMHSVLLGRSSSEEGRCDPTRAVTDVVATVSPEFQRRQVDLDLLLSGALPVARGDAADLEKALLWLLRERLTEAKPGDRVTLTARRMGESKPKGVIVSVVDRVGTEVDPDESPFCDEAESRVLSDAVAALGGRVHSVDEPGLGRVTTLRLRLAVL